MRIIFIALLVLPFFSHAQNNRSAKELAKENTGAYLKSSVFKGRTFKPVYLGEIKAFGDKNSDIVWTMDQKVETAEVHKTSGNNSRTVKQLYDCRFYLDKRLEVIRMDCYYNVVEE